MVMITLYAKQKKRHRCTEQTFGLCGRMRGWDVSRERFIISEASCFRHCPYYRTLVVFFLIQEFQKQLNKAKRIMIIGNGGIALELV